MLSLNNGSPAKTLEIEGSLTGFSTESPEVPDTNGTGPGDRLTVTDSQKKNIQIVGTKVQIQLAI